jgi:hypothetical protein
MVATWGGNSVFGLPSSKIVLNVIFKGLHAKYVHFKQTSTAYTSV